MNTLFAKTIFTCTLILGTLFSTNVYAKELRYANFPPTSTFPSIQMDEWIKVIEERTSNEIEIQTFPASTLLDSKTMLRGIAQGQADIGTTSLLYYPGSFPLFEVFGLPLGFSSGSEASFVAWEIFKAHKPKELARYKVLTMFTSAPSQIMSTKPVHSLEDLQNITLRASGTISDALDSMGANAVSIPMSDTPEALQKGVVDGVCSSWDTLYDMNFAEDCKFGLTVNMPVYPFVVIMNKDSWEKLPTEVQQQIDAYADEHALYTGKLVDNAGKHAIDWATAEHNFSLAEITAEEEAKIKADSAHLFDDWKENARKKGLDPELILADIEKFRAIYKEKHQ